MAELERSFGREDGMHRLQAGDAVQAGQLLGQQKVDAIEESLEKAQLELQQLQDRFVAQAEGMSFIELLETLLDYAIRLHKKA